MTVKELCTKTSLKPLSLPKGDREITGVYIGDLLSWVMGRAKESDAWITIMSNINIIAVASLADTACVIVAEGVELSKEIIDTAVSKQVNVLSSSENIYNTALILEKQI